MNRLVNTSRMASIALACLALSGSAFAQPAGAAPAAAPNTQAPAAAKPASSSPGITGKIDINYQSRVKLNDAGTAPQEGVKDTYALDVTVADNMVFQGKIEHLPTIFSSVLGREIQASMLAYDLNLIIKNPDPTKPQLSVGKVTGTAPIDKKGVYQYGNGNLRIAVDAVGRAPEFSSPFLGQVQGKAPKNDSTLANTKKSAMEMTRTVKGRAMKIVVTKYDLMAFTDFAMPKGPSTVFPDTRVTGEMVYDYERSAWYFKGVALNYRLNGKDVSDKISGHIKWVESPQRASNGEGEYQFDVRVNEPESAATENAVFQVASEADFFATDNSLSALTGTWKYKDQLRSTSEGPVPTASAVTINMTSNGLNRQQVVALWKLIGLVEIVPMNAE